MTELPRRSYSGPWIVRMAGRPTPDTPVDRAIDPLVARDLDQLTQVLSGLFSAISLLGPGHSLTVSVDAGTLDG
jgi:hypothetical protein